MQDAFATQTVFQTVLRGTSKASCTVAGVLSKTLLQDGSAAARRFCKTELSSFHPKRLACFWRFSAVLTLLQDAFLFSCKIRESHMRARTRPYEGEKSIGRAQKRLALGGRHGR